MDCAHKQVRTCIYKPFTTFDVGFPLRQDGLYVCIRFAFFVVTLNMLKFGKCSKLNIMTLYFVKSEFRVGGGTYYR